METPDSLHIGSDLFDKNGSKVGTVSDLIFEPTTLQLEWYDVKVGLLGAHHLVPAASVKVEETRGCLPFDKKAVKDAPKTSSPPGDEEKRVLIEHYRAA
jgi:uncharacterized protein YrrD